MEDFLAYLILVTVVLWFCRSIYKKIKGDAGGSGCGGGCGGCSMKEDTCDSVKPYNGE